MSALPFLERMVTSYKVFRSRRKWARRDDEGFAQYHETGLDYRAAIKHEVEKLSPSSVYEYGCWSGPNLKQFDCAIYGSDINERAVDYARNLLPHGKFIVTHDARKLDEWLPPQLDVVLVAGTYCCMSQADVVTTLEIFQRKFKYLVIADNFEHRADPVSYRHGRRFKHAWDSILAPYGQVISEADSPIRNYAVDRLVTVAFKA